VSWEPDYGAMRSLLERPSAEHFADLMELARDAPPERHEELHTYLEDRLDEWPDLARVPALEVCGKALYSGQMPWTWALARSVDTGRHVMMPENFERWAKTPELFAEVTHLVLDGAPRHVATMQPMQDVAWPKLRSLTFNDCIFPSGGLEGFFHEAQLEQLESLTVIFSTPFEHPQIHALCASPKLANLKTLAIYGNGGEGSGDISQEALEALGAATFRDSLQALTLGGSDVWASDYSAITKLSALERLSVRSSTVQSDPFIALLEHPELPETLHTLDLHHCSIYQGAERILGLELLSRLRTLVLTHGLLNIKSAGALIHRAPMAELRELHMRNGFHDEHLAALFEGPVFAGASLEVLDLRSYKATQKSLDSILARLGQMPGLRELWLDLGMLAGEGAAKLVEHEVWQRLEAFGFEANYDVTPATPLFQHVAAQLARAAHKPRIIVPQYKRSSFGQALEELGCEVSEEQPARMLWSVEGLR